jgi:undecaprenyl-diphosphatase
VGEDRKDVERRVEKLLERHVQRVRTPEEAEKVARRLEELAAGKTEEQAGRAAVEQGAGRSAVDAPGRAGGKDHPGPGPTAGTASTLAAVAAQTASPQPEAKQVVAAAQRVMRPAAPERPSVRRGRDLLREAMLRRMGRVDRLDARLFLRFNGRGHSPRLDRLANTTTELARGGWIWSVGLILAGLLGRRGAWAALPRLTPTVLLATLIVEHPVKALFRRRRPFVSVIRAVVVGKKPGSWSFPSGHSASSFAAAWVLTRTWPRRAPAFLGLAGLVAASRVYAGAHYPGDVASGALAGAVIAEACLRLGSLATTRSSASATAPALPSSRLAPK